MQKPIFSLLFLLLFNISTVFSQSSEIAYINIDTLHSHWEISIEMENIRIRVISTFENDYVTKIKQLQKLVSVYHSPKICHTKTSLKKVEEYLEAEANKIRELEEVYKYWVDSLDNTLKNVEKELLLASYKSFAKQYGYSMIIDSSKFLYSDQNNFNMTKYFYDFLNKSIEYELIIKELHEKEGIIISKGLEEGAEIQIAKN